MDYDYCEILPVGIIASLPCNLCHQTSNETEQIPFSLLQCLRRNWDYVPLLSNSSNFNLKILLLILILYFYWLLLTWNYTQLQWFKDYRISISSYQNHKNYPTAFVGCQGEKHSRRKLFLKSVFDELHPESPSMLIYNQQSTISSALVWDGYSSLEVFDLLQTM